MEAATLIAEKAEAYWDVANGGFLPSAPSVAPVDSAAATELIAADTVAAQLPVLDDSDVLAAVQELDVLERDALVHLGPAELEGALRSHSFLAHRLIHCGLLDEGNRLPAAVAHPLWQLSEIFGRPPGLTYAAYVLSNSAIAVPAWEPPDTIPIPRTFTGTPDEAWFIGVHLAIESIGGEVVEGLARCEAGMGTGETADVSDGLRQISAALEWAGTILPRIRERLDRDVFVEAVRPLLFGFHDVRLAGVPGEPSISYVGETGAQSGAMQAADSGLGITHDAAMTRALDRFAACAPPAHRRYMAWARGVGTALRAATDRDPAVKREHQIAAAALAAFREAHVKVVEAYLTSRNPLGTGGTRHHVWLRRLAADAREAAG